MKHRLPLCRNITFAGFFFFFFLRRENTFNIQARSDHSALTASFLISEFSTDLVPVLGLCPCGWLQAHETLTPPNAPWLSPAGEQGGFSYHAHPLQDLAASPFGEWGFSQQAKKWGQGCRKEEKSMDLVAEPTGSGLRLHHTPALTPGRWLHHTHL